MARFRALVAYDGGEFHGFAPNEGVATIGGALNEALGRVTGTPVAVACAGRTDTGVHGLGQVISFDAPDDVDPARIQHSINRMLGPTIAVRDLGVAADDFDARFSAKSRTYRYRILNRAVPDPFLRTTTWHLPGDLDLAAMNDAARALVGEHDFASFCRKKVVTVDGVELEADLTREVRSIRWARAEDDLVDHWITATAFCHQMVRAITGTLVEVGLGRRAGDSLAATLAARDRQAAGALAPPHGLTLWSVEY